MNTISINYTLICQFKKANHYKITKCKKVFNTKTGRQIKQCCNGGSIGYWIAGIFIVKNNLNKHIEKIKISQTPF